MKELWHDTNELNEALGEDFDVAAGWEDFNKEKEKKRIILFWFWGALALLGLALAIWFVLPNTKEEFNKGRSKSNLVLANPNNLQIKEEVINDETPKGATSGNTTNNLFSNSPKEESKAQPANHFGKGIIKVKSISTNDDQDSENEFLIDELPKNRQIENTVKQSANSSELLFGQPYAINANRRLAIAELNTLPVLIQWILLENENINPNWQNPLTQTQSTNKLLKPWTMGLTYIYNRPQRKIRGEEEAYQNLRQIGEQFLEQQQIDFTISRSLNRHFFLSSGLTYGRYRSRLVEKIQELRSPFSYENVVVETQTQNNVTNEIRGTVIGSQLSINQSTRYQLYQTLGIPIQLGFQIPVKQHWQISLRSGLTFNLWQHTRGNTYASILPNGEFVPISTLEYRSLGSIESASNLEVRRKITKTLNVHLGIQTKFDINNRLENNTGVSDKWKSYGLSIGISKNW